MLPDSVGNDIFSQTFSNLKLQTNLSSKISFLCESDSKTFSMEFTPSEIGCFSYGHIRTLAACTQTSFYLIAVSHHSSSFFFFFFLEKALKFFLNSEHIKKINVSVIVEVKLDNCHDVTLLNHLGYLQNISIMIICVIIKM